MNRKSFVNCITLALVFVTVVGAFVSYLYYPNIGENALLIAGLVVLGAIFLMAMNNYSSSAYGGKFHERYPDSKARMTDRK